MNALFALLTFQAALGAFDNFWHHEVTERLPQQRWARREIALHAAREFIYALVFLAFAWTRPQGLWAWCLAGLLLIEIGITLADFVVEDQTRHLPRLERIAHTVLAINYGIFLAVLYPLLASWTQASTALVVTAHGAWSWWFTLCAIGLLVWSVRNAVAALVHSRPPEWARNPLLIGQSDTPRTVLISGATGFVGGHLVRALLARGDRVTVWTRDKHKALARFGPHVQIIDKLDSLTADSKIDAIVNLAGAGILDLPWTRGRRRVLLESRLKTTEALVALCARLDRRPQVLVSASAIGYYGIHGGELLTEKDGPQDIFQSQLCQQWERGAEQAGTYGVRVVLLRIGVVLGIDGGALPRLALPIRLGFGAVLGHGRQWLSWIHISDLVRLIQLALDRQTCRGAINASAPGACTQREFSLGLARRLRRPLWLRIPAWLPRLLLGEMAQLLFDGQRVSPSRATMLGFSFEYARLEHALAALYAPPSCAAGGSLEVFYNGACPVCDFEMQHYRRIADRDQLALQVVDVVQQPRALQAYGLRTDHVEGRLYARDADGRVRSGMDAMVAVWQRLPGYRWLARVATLPGLSACSHAIYDHLVAPNLANWARSRQRRMHEG